jgi:hypothetical protein
MTRVGVLTLSGVSLGLLGLIPLAFVQAALASPGAVPTVTPETIAITLAGIILACGTLCLAGVLGLARTVVRV